MFTRLNSYTFCFCNNIHAVSLVKNYLNSKQDFTEEVKYYGGMNEEAKNFARNLKFLMDYHEDTQQSLEKRSGVSQKTISNMLNPGDERSPNLNKVALVANAYKLKTWHMLLPDATLEILTNSSVEKLIETYITIDAKSKDVVLRVAENAVNRDNKIATAI